MPIPPDYVGREQTFAKHLFFKFYLEILAYHILSFKDGLVYVDGFSGPWESKNADYKDTSFAIALEKLEEVRKKAEETYQKPKKIRCLFIEKDPATFAKLQAFIQKEKPAGIEVQILNGDFESLIDEIKKFIGPDFAFVFIDPTGWTGYAYEKIKPLFQQKGEFLINFMYDFIQRFVKDERSKEGFEKLFGGGDWEKELAALEASGMSREQAIVELYCQRLRKISDNPIWGVTYSPISHPLKDRSWFYLIYATTHVRGLQKFHEAEDKALEGYGEVRQESLSQKKAEKTGMADLFGASLEKATAFPLDHLQETSRAAAPQKIAEFLKKNGKVKYDKLAFEILQLPLLSDKALKKSLLEMRDKGEIVLDGLMTKGGIKGDTLVYLKN